MDLNISQKHEIIARLIFYIPSLKKMLVGPLDITIKIPILKPKRSVKWVFDRTKMFD